VEPLAPPLPTAVAAFGSGFAPSSPAPRPVRSVGDRDTRPAGIFHPSSGTQAAVRAQ